MDLERILAEDVLQAARALLGATLIVRGQRARIVETEAYGPQDPGCHAFRGQTPRNAIMFGPPGHSYVYFTYGNHWMLNVTALREGTPGAVLIRALEPEGDLQTYFVRRPKAKHPHELMNGPGKLCQALGITKDDLGANLMDAQSPLKIEPGSPVREIGVGTRIGLAAGKGDDFPWRFWDRDAERFVSRPLTPCETS